MDVRGSPIRDAHSTLLPYRGQHNTNMASNKNTNMVSNTKTDMNINDILSFPLFKGQLLTYTCNSIHYTGTFLFLFDECGFSQLFVKCLLSVAHNCLLSVCTQRKNCDVY